MGTVYGSRLIPLMPFCPLLRAMHDSFGTPIVERLYTQVRAPAGSVGWVQLSSAFILASQPLLSGVNIGKV